MSEKFKNKKKNLNLKNNLLIQIKKRYYANFYFYLNF